MAISNGVANGSKPNTNTEWHPNGNYPKCCKMCDPLEKRIRNKQN